MRNFTMRLLYIFFALICVTQDIIAQEAVKLGDSLPADLLDIKFEVVNSQHGNSHIVLGDYENKLMLLDFWATWCTPCIKSLNKLDALQREFGDELVVLPVTYEATEKALSTFQERGWNMPSVVNDTLLKKWFPFRTIPHQVWIKGGKLLAVTGPEYATSDNIRKILREESVDMLMKEDIMDIDKIPYQTPIYESTLSPRIKNYSSGISRHKQGIKAYNVSFKSLLIEAYSSDYNLSQIPAMMVWEISDSLRKEITAKGLGLQGDYGHDLAYNEWLDNVLFCYNLTLSSESVADRVANRSKIRQIMKSEIAILLKVLKGVSCAVERRKIPHLMLVKTQSGSQLLQKRNGPDDVIFENAPTDHFLKALSYNLETPVLADESIDSTVFMTLDLSSRQIESVNQQLKCQGFELISVMKEADALVFKKVNTGG